MDNVDQPNMKIDLLHQNNLHYNYLLDQYLQHRFQFVSFDLDFSVLVHHMLFVHFENMFLVDLDKMKSLQFLFVL